MTSIVIKNENDFLSFIQTISENFNLNSDEFKLPDVKFNGWPTLHINVKGDSDRYNSSVTVPLLFGMSDLVNEMQRAYALIKYGSDNLQRLTNQDKTELDFVFKIKEGSSDASSQQDDYINGIISCIKTGMKRMNGWQTMTFLIMVVGAVGFGTHEYFLTQRHDSSNQVALVTASTNAVNKAYENIAQIYQQGETKLAKETSAHIENGNSKLLKQLASDPTVDKVSIGNQTVSRDELDTINTRQRVTKVKTEKNDTFKIKGIQWTGSMNQDISITVSNENDETLIIKATEDVITSEELEVLSQALAKKSQININYLEISENGIASFGQFNKINE